MSATVQTKFVRTDLTPKIGSELKADVDALVNGEVSAEIRALLEERGVVVFRELNLTDEQQIAFTKTLGPIVESDVFKISMDPKVNPVAADPQGAFYRP